MGKFCKICDFGTFGDATTDIGCQPCHCNGQAHMNKESCDSNSGKCFCTDFTEGHNCERCMDGFHGDPMNGGTCRFSCNGKTIISDVDEGSLGLQTKIRGKTKGSNECLWIISSTRNLTSKFYPKERNKMNRDLGIIHLKLEKGVDVPCSNNNILVYDGLPPFMSPDHEKTNLLGALCGQSLKTDVNVEPKSGLLSIVFTDSHETSGFNVTFEILQCPKKCEGDRYRCEHDKCVCKPEWTGEFCQYPFCPDDCSSSRNQGYCNRNQGQCICKPGFGLENCSLQTHTSDIVTANVGINEKTNEVFARIGHSMITDSNDLIWIFGGYNPSYGPLQDIRAFDATTNSFKVFTIHSQQLNSHPMLGSFTQLYFPL
jgi:hypothetical protein